MRSAHSKAAPPENGPGITFPPSTAQKRVLPNGLTIIVQEDRSAPVASVQAWCGTGRDRKSTRLNSSHDQISYAVFCLKKKKKTTTLPRDPMSRPPKAHGKY